MDMDPKVNKGQLKADPMLRYARSLKKVGVPNPFCDVNHHVDLPQEVLQAIMAEEDLRSLLDEDIEEGDIFLPTIITKASDNCGEKMKKKVIFVSRHELSPGQVNAIKALHGEDCEIDRDPHVFQGQDGLTEYIRSNADAFVYAVAGSVHVLDAALNGASFGIFENYPGKRANGEFGLSAVYQVRDDQLVKVYENPDPMSDIGETLKPVAR